MKKHITLYCITLFILTLWWMTPLFLHYMLDGVLLSVWRSGLLSLGISSLVLLPKKKWVRSILFILMTITTMMELFMVKQYGVFLTYAHTLVLFGTNFAEANTFVSANIGTLIILVPYVLFSCLILVVVCHIEYPLILSYGVFFWAMGILLGCISIISFRWHIAWHDAFVNVVDERVPINVWENAYLASKHMIDVSSAKTMDFGAYSCIERPSKEVVVAIGESVRYANFAMNGTYHRNTTPLMQTNPNAILFTDYATTGCITMQAVPMILTRGTPECFEKTYQESGVQRVFQEIGFHVVAFRHNLIGDRLHDFLLNGADEVLEPDSDAQIPLLVDSLSKCYDHLFVYFQLDGSHAYYANYPDSFNKWQPNINSNSKSDIPCDSLLINAYDNTILYTDYLLNDMLKKLNIGGGGRILCFMFQIMARPSQKQMAIMELFVMKMRYMYLWLFGYLMNTRSINLKSGTNYVSIKINLVIQMIFFIQYVVWQV